MIFSLYILLKRAINSGLNLILFYIDKIKKRNIIARDVCLVKNLILLEKNLIIKNNILSKSIYKLNID